MTSLCKPAQFGAQNAQVVNVSEKLWNFLKPKAPKEDPVDKLATLESKKGLGPSL